MTAARQALFAPAASLQTGGGHLMRCLTLAEALAARDVQSTFVVPPFGRVLIERFGMGATSMLDVGLETAVALRRFDFVIVDDYALAAEQEAALKGRCGALIALDDLADRAHDVDLLIDPSYGRRAEHYLPLTPSRTRTLLGQNYALLRPAFAALRASALERPVVDQPKRLFLSFGLSDIDAIAARATRLIRQYAPAVQVDVALSSAAASAEVLRRQAQFDPRLIVHLDATKVAELVAAADFSIGAGGVSTWERCCLGSPTLAVIVADNQRAMIERLAANEVVLKADLGATNFDAAFLSALDLGWAPEVRKRLKTRSATLCDGLGAGRVADAILAL